VIVARDRDLEAQLTWRMHCHIGARSERLRWQEAPTTMNKYDATKLLRVEVILYHERSGPSLAQLRRGLEPRLHLSITNAARWVGIAEKSFNCCLTWKTTELELSALTMHN
jgi:hypothetical protein